MSLKWFAVRTEPNRERVAKSYLETWIEEIYMPVCEKPTILDIHRRDDEGRNISVMESQKVKSVILTGYLFIRLDMSAAAANEIALTRGVLWLLPNNHKPEPIPQAEFERLKTLCDALTTMSDPDESQAWMVGKIMRISGGAYQGYQGECRAVTREHAVIRLGMFKTEIDVPIPIECVDSETVATDDHAHVVKSKLFGYKGRIKRA